MKFVTSRILEKDQGNIVVHGNTWIGHRSMKLRTGLVFFFFFCSGHFSQNQNRAIS